jgi:hypothetical protein
MKRLPGITNSTGPRPNWRRSCCIRLPARVSAWVRSRTRTTGRRLASTPAAIDDRPKSVNVVKAAAPVT